MKIDFGKFERSLPYDSELFGIYQPLLGWKSRRIRKRFFSGLKDTELLLLDAIAARFRPDAHLDFHDFNNEKLNFSIDRLNPGTQRPELNATIPMTLRTYVAELVAQRINEMGIDVYDERIWRKLVSREALDELLPMVRTKLQDNYEQIIEEGLTAKEMEPGFNDDKMRQRALEVLTYRMNRESVVAGVINHLYETKKFDLLKQLFFAQDGKLDLSPVEQLSEFIDPMESFNPKADIGLVSLSPVGVVHLFRQYFFEFDNFLGPAVQHIWLTPGSSLELVEVHTRKQIIERTVESSIETIQKSEKSLTEQDELASAVKDENQNNAKFGFSVNAGGSVSGGVPGVYSATGHVDTTTSYGLDTNQKVAKEAAHKQMRTQSDKLSSEIRQNFKTTFKSITEVTDTSSKRYVLANNTTDLLNYELRRKMRQVGVQVQDIGTQLCWQTYVDLPGSDLGLANLVHLAEPPDLAALPHPQQQALPQPITKDFTAKLYFQGWTGDNDTNQTYIEHTPLSDQGWAVSDGSGNDRIHVNYLDYQVEEIPGYELKQVVFENCIEGKLVEPQFYNYDTKKFSIHLRKVNFDGDAITLKLKLAYAPTTTTISNIQAQYNAEMQKYDIAKAQLAKDAFIKSARERIKLASNIQPRKFEELREEERTIVYRHLIGSLLDVGVDLSNKVTRHVMAELINSMFDVDKMLYFVAPEWWMPRQRQMTLQNVGGNPGQLFRSEDIVSWDGAGANYRPNYYITDESSPAKMGSSLGWLLQLDGDNLRNTFLNAPWVKAVIPIRPGKELAALNWLMHAKVEGSDGLDARYQEAVPNELDDMVTFLEGYPWEDGDRKVRYTDFANKINQDPEHVYVSIRDALIYLSLQIKLKDAISKKVKTENVDGDPVSYLPTEKVYEHGFDPLAGGFQAQGKEPFAVFDQWVEVLPTDQVVAVEVKYDPKTGMML